MLDFAVQTAREAGHILAERFGRVTEVSHKGEINLVTEADLASERFIIERIKSYYPRHAILAEESGASVERGSDYVWIVDPLDGTTNYAHGYPVFAVSIALEYRGEIVLGVVYDPMRDELFAAERGAGATLNGRRVRVSDVEDLSKAMLCTGFPYDVRERGELIGHFRNFIMTAQAVRRDGSAALDLAYVACGRFDGFWEEGLNPWDVAAGVLLVEEAGGRVTDYAGHPFSSYYAPVLASNGLIHEAMMRVLAPT
ncbi:inositol monophosphatase family protein [Pyrinomonas methylaliphatogenes]|uniref:Inositol-1-monophosphatase n=1 Tax=Pyrinomonas methylaliphatogenes TaxID=454194 RepID=A0A0B6WXJ5_9BACT|nr:inositol monophosphatase family protein [Pyrinomonas methylaliphatogenes]MBX5477441.1 inositol monophosphatase [Pyrinomonas methylaliphatogenes]CDM65811.1 inositol monophosphatase/fructose-1,6-bisphosphatase family protein [Pyrinomonas methylaliphatogenes]